MIINSVLSSTKDNSIQNNNHKKKLFLNSKISNKNSNKYDNNNIINETKQKSKKQRIILPNNVFYEGYLINNEFNGYGEYRSPYYNYFG